MPLGAAVILILVNRREMHTEQISNFSLCVAKKASSLSQMGDAEGLLWKGWGRGADWESLMLGKKVNCGKAAASKPGKGELWGSESQGKKKKKGGQKAKLTQRNPKSSLIT